MYKTSLGIDIGTYQLKMFLYDGEKCQKIFTLPMSENIIKNDKIKSSEQISESIKKIVCENKIKTKKCRIVLPESLVFVRQTNVPYMTIDNLKQNLPYEFRDFITAEKDKYFYDYIVLDTIKDESGTNKSIDIMAAAVLKSTINEYTQIMKRADLKLEVALPEEFAYRNVICDYELRNFLKKDDNFKLPQKKKLNEYCFIDLGHFATRLFIFVGSKSAATHVISYGGSIIDDAISDLCGVDAK
ncbi:MAG: pilus assembly protein PilM, partial [Clostridia bacterium]